MRKYSKWDMEDPIDLTNIEDLLCLDKRPRQAVHKNLELQKEPSRWRRRAPGESNEYYLGTFIFRVYVQSRSSNNRVRGAEAERNGVP